MLFFGLFTLAASVLSCNTWPWFGYWKGGDMISKDVAIIGGGVSGTYAAVTLLEQGYPVVLAEKDAALGGRVETYTVPRTDTTIEYGVHGYYNTSVVRDFFAHFDLPLTNATFPRLRTIYADFSTAKPVPDFVPSRDTSKYQAQLAKYLDLGLGAQLPQPIPKGLLLPFGDFVKKYGLGEEAFSIYSAASAAGLGNILDLLTMDVMKFVEEVWFKELAGAVVVPASYNNQKLYGKALAALGSNAMVSSTVISWPAM
jgi:hypothetical protein